MKSIVIEKFAKEHFDNLQNVVKELAPPVTKVTQTAVLSFALLALCEKLNADGDFLRRNPVEELNEYFSNLQARLLEEIA